MSRAFNNGFIDSINDENRDDFNIFRAITSAVAGSSHYLVYYGWLADKPLPDYPDSVCICRSDVFNAEKFPQVMHQMFLKPKGKRPGYSIKMEFSSLNALRGVASVIKNLMNALEINQCQPVLDDHELFAPYISPAKVNFDNVEPSLLPVHGDFIKVYAQLKGQSCHQLINGKLEDISLGSEEALQLYRSSGVLDSIYTGQEKPLSVATQFFSPVKLALEDPSKFSHLGEFKVLQVDASLKKLDDFIFIG